MQKSYVESAQKQKNSDGDMDTLWGGMGKQTSPCMSLWCHSGPWRRSCGVYNTCGVHMKKPSLSHLGNGKKTLRNYEF